MPRLTGRKIMITGGASGIGRATCELFVREGAAIAVLDRDVARVAGAHAIAADVSNADAVSRAMQEAAQALGGLDGLVNAAGVFINRGLSDTTSDVWNTTIAVNLTGTFLCVQAAVPLLRQAERATVVNIASGVGLLPTGGGSTAYVASKGGVIAMTRTLAAELAPTIRVNAVCPGAVETPMTDGTLRNSSGASDSGHREPLRSWPSRRARGDRRRNPVFDLARKLVRDGRQPGRGWRSDIPLTARPRTNHCAALIRPRPVTSFLGTRSG